MLIVYIHACEIWIIPKLCPLSPLPLKVGGHVPQLLWERLPWSQAFSVSLYETHSNLICVLLTLLQALRWDSGGGGIPQPRRCVLPKYFGFRLTAVAQMKLECKWFSHDMTWNKSINHLKPNSSNCYTLPYRSNLPFSISDIPALWRSRLSAIVPECQKLKMAGYACMALNTSNVIV